MQTNISDTQLITIDQLSQEKLSDIVYLKQIYTDYITNDSTDSLQGLYIYRQIIKLKQIDLVTNDKHGTKEYKELNSEATSINAKIKKTEKDVEKLSAKIDSEINLITTVSDFPHIDSTCTRILNHSENTAYLFKKNSVTIRYNELIKDVEIEIPSFKTHDQTKNSTQITALKDIAVLENVPTVDINEHVIRIAGANAYHPVRDWFNALPNWDGVDRINTELFSTFVLKDVGNIPLQKTLLNKWLVQCCTSVMNPKGCGQQGVLVLVGNQGIGKSSWIRSITPDPSWVSTDMQINPSDKDDVNRFIKNWIIELGELGSTFRKADIDALKSFITRDYDEFRLPFARKPEKYVRQTSFYATVNDVEFLTDDENRRYWPIEVEAVNFEHKIDLQQLWSQVLSMYKNGHTYWLTTEERNSLNVYNNTKFKMACPVAERFIAKGYCKPSETNLVTWLTCTEILLNIGISNPSKGDSNKLGKYLRDNGFERNRQKKWGVSFAYEPNMPVQHVPKEKEPFHDFT
jgi:putative DNA primase/helicase